VHISKRRSARIQPKPNKNAKAANIINQYGAKWWRSRLQNNAVEDKEVTNNAKGWLRRGNRVLLCPITLMPICEREAFYVNRVFYDANAIAAHCLKNGFTDPVSRDVQFSNDDVVRMSRKLKTRSLRQKLLHSYQNKEYIKRVRDEENLLLSNYHAVLDLIFEQIKRYSTNMMLNTRIRYTQRNVEASVAIDQGWMPLWVTMLQYRGVHEQVCELNRVVGNTTQRYHQHALQSLHTQLPSIYRGPCPKAYKQSCEVLCSFIAASLASLDSTNIIQHRSNFIRNRNRFRLFARTNMTSVL